MVTRKTPPIDNRLRNETVLDKHFESAFKEILKILKHLIKDLAKEPAIERSKGFRSYSQTLKGFVQNNVSKKHEFRITVNVDAEFDKNLVGQNLDT